ncbi:MAG: glycosyltransferase family A protein [Patescibacteria group bacterium]|jgi:glycosyltransferase involved in cell wall biosynthesis
MSLKNPDEHIKISIVIPAYNEELTIARCLRSVTEQSLPRDEYEIILVDNNCTDNTVKIANTFDNIIIVQETNPGVGAARAAGWARARGEIIASTDADCQVPKHWLRKILHRFTVEPHLVAISGGYLFYDRNFLINILVRIVERCLVALSWFLAGGVMAMTANNMAVRQSVYAQTSGIDPNLQYGEDLNLAKKLHAYGSIRWVFNNRIKTTARRFQGLNLSVVPYALNFVSMSARNKAFKNHLKTIRK